MIVKLTNALTNNPLSLSAEHVTAFERVTIPAPAPSPPHYVIRGDVLECTWLLCGGTAFYVDELPYEITTALSKATTKLEERMIRAHRRILRDGPDTDSSWKESL